MAPHTIENCYFLQKNQKHNACDIFAMAILCNVCYDCYITIGISAP